MSPLVLAQLALRNCLKDPFGPTLCCKLIQTAPRWPTPGMAVPAHRPGPRPFTTHEGISQFKPGSAVSPGFSTD